MIMNKDEVSSKIEELLEKSYVVIDFLPEQVSAEKGDNFFKTEAFFLNHKESLYRHFACFIIKLSSYFDLIIDDNKTMIDDFDPQQLSDMFVSADQQTCLNILLPEKDCLISFHGDDLYMTVYNADHKLKELSEKLAISEQLFLR